MPGGASVNCAAPLVTGTPAALLTVTVYAPTFAALMAGSVNVMVLEIVVLLTRMVAEPPAGSEPPLIGVGRRTSHHGGELNRLIGCDNLPDRRGGDAYRYRWVDGKHRRDDCTLPSGLLTIT